MSNIDLTRIITAQDKAAQAAQARASSIKTECKARILAVCNEVVQINLAAAAAAGRLSPDQQAAFGAGLQWIEDMRAACAARIADTATDPSERADWPPVPVGVAELTQAF